MKVETIAARLTPNIPAAIATIGIEGPDAIPMVQTLAKLRASSLEVGRIHFGTWNIVSALHSDRNADPSIAKVRSTLAAVNDPAEWGHEQVVLCRTGEQRVEVHCHGGSAVCKAILRTLHAAGCQLTDSRAWPSEWECPLARAAEQDLSRARTDRAAGILLDQLNGALTKEVDAIVTELELHPADEELDRVSRRIRSLLKWASFGEHLSSAWSVVFAGPPNVGKSSLMNAVMGHERSIVHADAGTTRDWIESATAVAGWPVDLTDTAGIRLAADLVEQQGVEKAKERIRKADLIVWVVDSQVGWTEQYQEMAADCVAPAIVCWNKADLSARSNDTIPDTFPVYATSAVADPGVRSLLKGIESALWNETPPPGAAVPFRAFHRKMLSSALESIETEGALSAATHLRRMLDEPSSAVRDGMDWPSEF